MLRNSIVFLLFGLIWLFIFSIPIGNQGHRLFNLAYYYIVDTKMVHLVTNLVSSTAHKTEGAAGDVVDDVTNRIDQNQSQ